MSVLPYQQLQRRCLERNGDADPLVYPLAPDAVQPSSIDLRLGSSFRVFEDHKIACVDLAEPSTFADATRLVQAPDSMLIHPGEFVLGETFEQVTVPNDLVVRVEGKSSVGRLGLIVHATAGYVDPGFTGRITLEMTNLLRVPIKVRPGLFICQISAQLLTEPTERPYAGRYQGDRGVAASRYGIEALTPWQDPGAACRYTAPEYDQGITPNVHP